MTTFDAATTSQHPAGGRDTSRHHLGLEVSDWDRTRCVHVSGRLDWATVEQLRAALRACRDDRPLVLDIGEVGSLDAAGTGLILSTLCHHHAAGAPVVIVARHPTVCEVLARVGVDAIAPVVATIEDARRRLHTAVDPVGGGHR